MAPAHDAHTIRVHEVAVLHHPVAGGEGVLHLQAAVVDELVEPSPVAGAPPVLGGHHDVALLNQLPDDVGVAGAHVGVDSPVGEDDERMPPRRLGAPRREGVGPEDDRVPRPLGRRVGDHPGRRPRHPHLVHVGDVAHPVVPEDVIHRLLEDVEGVHQHLLLLLQLLDDLVDVLTRHFSRD